MHAGVAHATGRALLGFTIDNQVLDLLRGKERPNGAAILCYVICRSAIKTLKGSQLRNLIASPSSSNPDKLYEEPSRICCQGRALATSWVLLIVSIVAYHNLSRWCP